MSGIDPANGLLERNVVGAMNANVAFHRGLSEGGAFGGSMTTKAILDDVWASAPAIRAETPFFLGILALLLLAEAVPGPATWLPGLVRI